MSRYIIQNVELSDDAKRELYENTETIKYLADIEGMWEVAYGFDSGFGYFLQLWPINEVSIRFFGELTDWDEECFDFCSILNGLRGAELAFFLQQIGCKEQNHINMAYLDCSFQEEK